MLQLIDDDKSCILLPEVLSKLGLPQHARAKVGDRTEFRIGKQKRKIDGMVYDIIIKFGEALRFSTLEYIDGANRLVAKPKNDNDVNTYEIDIIMTPAKDFQFKE
jgi:hypothetical protein